MQSITLMGTVVPKARPRVTKRGTAYMPKNYTDWKSATIKRLQLDLTPVTEAVAISVSLSGKHSRRGDLDNVAGSCLDALVQSGILPDDNMINVTSLSVSIDHSDLPPHFTIKILPLLN